MCGIFGVIANSKSAISVSELITLAERLLVSSEIRGREASGILFAVNGHAIVIKAAVAAKQLLSTLAYKEGCEQFIRATGLKSSAKISQPTVILGHARMATSGDIETYEDNQPIVTDRTIGVHNGIVVNNEEIWRQNPSLIRHKEVDSEIIFELLGNQLSESTADLNSLNNLLKSIDGQCSFVSVHRDLDAVFFATNNGSLYSVIGAAEQPRIFGSERRIISSALKNYHHRLLMKIPMY